MHYRREIDGLRAVAVVAVILFHAGIETVSGGFIGVDIFFVISGYLISGILIEKIENGEFSFLEFYERRIRRIIPALYFVIVACMPFAWMWMLPQQFLEFSRSIVSVVLFVSNVLFWRESGYFAGNSDEKPLLHTWSLGVEEQFYLVFPIFLIFIFRFFRKHVVFILIVLTIIGLAATEIFWRINVSANFYLIPSRIWELLAGSVAAFVVRKNGVYANNILSLSGLCLVIGSLLIFEGSMIFPRVYSAIPIIGTFLIIVCAGERTFVRYILSTRALVAVGLLSYSAYLWHQPIFAFARLRLVNEPGPELMLALGACSILIGYVSYRFVEQPFRLSGERQVFSRKFILTGAATGSLVLIVLGILGTFVDENVSRISSGLESYVKPRVGDTSGCKDGLNLEEIRSGKRCLIGAPDTRVTVALLGDSHAATLTDALSARLKQKNIAAAVYTRAWCAPLQAFGTDAVGKSGCREPFDATYAQVMSDPAIDTVVILAQWSNFTVGYRWRDDIKAAYQFHGGGDEADGPARIDDNPAQFETALRYSIGNLVNSGKRVVLILSVPEFEFEIPSLLRKQILFTTYAEAISITDRQQYERRNLSSRSILKAVIEEFRLDQVDPLEIFCANGPCEFVAADREPLYRDDNHLTYRGAERVVDEVVERLDK